jgi:hypothetical protein
MSLDREPINLESHLQSLLEIFFSFNNSQSLSFENNLGNLLEIWRPFTTPVMQAIFPEAVFSSS